MYLHPRAVVALVHVAHLWPRYRLYASEAPWRRASGVLDKLSMTTRSQTSNCYITLLMGKLELEQRASRGQREVPFSVLPSR